MLTTSRLHTEAEWSICPIAGSSYTASLAVKAALDITDEIDKHVDPMDSAMTKLRKQNCSFAYKFRISHTFITHSFLLKGEDLPLCIPCQEPFSMKHILLECTDFRIIRSRFFRVNSLNELFGAS